MHKEGGMGLVNVPLFAFFVLHFHLQLPIIRAFGFLKQAAAETNRSMGKLDNKLAVAIIQACQEVKQ